ncbi:MAG: cupredoxin family copper-binding protein [Chloroflexota bacterium]|nr:cupredoxin family copper-binding protein [Chloroflexota bacterium]
MPRLLIIIISAALLTLGLPLRFVQAQAERCFPETAKCISGRFGQYWEQNGALPVFGFPISAAANERNRDTNQTYLTQWFERNRFEQHPENQAPYDVLLGRLGDDRLRQQGRNWQAEPREGGPQNGCLWFEQTGHNVCNQAGNLGFRSYWERNGLRDPRLDRYGQSLALFGLPLTEPKMETNTSGDTVLTQWFERARFEWHPDKPDRFKVLLGLLGNEVRTPAPSMVNVEIAQFTYQPTTVQVVAGGMVHWNNADDVDHTVTHGTPDAPGTAFDSGIISPGGAFAFTFSQPGSYPYYCTLHPSMRGVVTVAAP